jgi:hypothetical protein
MFSVEAYSGTGAPFSPEGITTTSDVVLFSRRIRRLGVIIGYYGFPGKFFDHVNRYLTLTALPPFGVQLRCGVKSRNPTAKSPSCAD